MKRHLIQLMVIISIALASCSKKNTNSPYVATPTVTTAYATNVTQTTAMLGGEVTYDGGATVTARGVCWNTTGSPKITDSKISGGSGTGIFSTTVTGLDAETTYYVQAYATNSKGTDYGNEVSFTTSELPCDGTVTDIDGNEYCTMTIGSQTWMAENLKVTKYRDGTPIEYITSAADWYYFDVTTGKYTLNTNSSYGNVYNHYAVKDSRNLAPVGWHIPTNAEWNTLFATSSESGLKAKNWSGTNSSGFKALPNGFIDDYGEVNDVDINAYWWSADEFIFGASTYGYRVFLGDNNTSSLGYYKKIRGYAVRCIKD